MALVFFVVSSQGVGWGGGGGPVSHVNYKKW